MKNTRTRMGGDPNLGFMVQYIQIAQQTVMMDTNKQRKTIMLPHAYLQLIYGQALPRKRTAIPQQSNFATISQIRGSFTQQRWQTELQIMQNAADNRYAHNGHLLTDYAFWQLICRLECLSRSAGYWKSSTRIVSAKIPNSAFYYSRKPSLNPLQTCQVPPTTTTPTSEHPITSSVTMAPTKPNECVHTFTLSL